jgi:hypothetical protein
VTRFVPFHELREPNIIADGPATDGTVLTLSHWPAAATPHPLRDDLSAQIVFHYLEAPDRWPSAGVASNNHFDEDGLVSLFALVRPDFAMARRAFLIDVAWTGDFQEFRSREAARVSFTINAFAQPESCPLGAALFRKPYPETCAALYTEGLARLPEMISHPERYRALWEKDDAQLAADLGRVRLEEFPALDLAVVRGRFHPSAIYTATRMNRIARIDGARFELQYRYESWVRYLSRPIRPRVDLRPLAARLGDLEPGWEFEGVEHPSARLHRPDGGESRLASELWLAMVKDALRP